MLNLPFLILFITKIKQAGNMEKKFNKIMQHQKNKSQMIQAVKKNTYTHTLRAERWIINEDRLAYYLINPLNTPQRVQLTSKDKLQQCERGKGQCRQADGEHLPATRNVHYRSKHTETVLGESEPAWLCPTVPPNALTSHMLQNALNLCRSQLLQLFKVRSWVCFN